MIGNKRCLVIAIAVLVTTGHMSFAATMDDPTMNGAPARVLGMGSAFVAVADDASSQIFNPAGLVTLKQPQLLGMSYTKMYDSYYYLVANGAYPTEFGTFGVGGVFSGIGDIKVTDTATGPTKSASYQDNVLLLSYASNLKRFVDLGSITRRIYVGTNLKLFGKSFSGPSSYAASGYNFDVGVKYVYSRSLTFGLDKQNILGGNLTWDTGNQELYPSPLFVGAAYRTDLYDRKQTIAMDAELPSETGYPTLLHIGTEYQLYDNLALRGGLDQILDADEATYWNMSFGLGLYMGQGFMLDYAYHPYYGDPNNSAHYVTISYVGEIMKKGETTIGLIEEDDELSVSDNTKTLTGGKEQEKCTNSTI